MTELKYDKGKPELNLIPPGTMTAMGQVMTQAVTRTDPAPHERDSWKAVEPPRYVAALLRHMDAILGGEVLDSESGLPHIDHVLTNAAFLSFIQRGRDRLQDKPWVDVIEAAKARPEKGHL